MARDFLNYTESCQMKQINVYEREVRGCSNVPKIIIYLFKYAREAFASISGRPEGSSQKLYQINTFRPSRQNRKHPEDK